MQLLRYNFTYLWLAFSNANWIPHRSQTIITNTFCRQEQFITFQYKNAIKTEI